MKKLIKQIKNLSNEELKRANEKFPLFASHHEGYAIIKEEIEELAQELVDLNMNLDRMWNHVKENNKAAAISDADSMRYYAMNAAAEAIQVVAMCEKFIKSFEEAKKVWIK